jgi:molybdopterin-synthase adenylyltransferase
MPEKENRYARHVVIPEISEAGQKKITDSAVLIVGCGALGSVQAQLLARAGVGQLRIVDADLPEEVNLQRQILFDEVDVAHQTPKAIIAANKLRKINSAIKVEGFNTRADASNIENLIKGMALVMDASDNFETRYLINDACVKNGLPWIYGGVIGTTGMSMPIIPKQGPCMRCVFPDPPEPGSSPTGVSAGILNSAPLAVGALQSAAALKIIVGASLEPHKLTLLDLWQSSFRSVEVLREEECPCCQKEHFEFLKPGAF